MVNLRDGFNLFSFGNPNIKRYHIYELFEREWLPTTGEVTDLEITGRGIEFLRSKNCMYISRSVLLGCWVLTTKLIYMFFLSLKSGNTDDRVNILHGIFSLP